MEKHAHNDPHIKHGKLPVNAGLSPITPITCKIKENKPIPFLAQLEVSA